MKREIYRTGFQISVKDGSKTATLVIEIDAEALARKLARKAILNNSRKAILGGGLIVCRAENIKSFDRKD